MYRADIGGGQRGTEREAVGVTHTLDRVLGQLHQVVFLLF